MTTAPKPAGGVDGVVVPRHLHELGVLALKQYALVLRELRDQSTTDGARKAVDLMLRSTADLVQMLGDCVAPEPPVTP